MGSLDIGDTSGIAGSLVQWGTDGLAFRDSSQIYIVQWPLIGVPLGLTALILSAGTLSPAFTSGATAYTASVPNSASSITVTPTTANSAATVQVRVNSGQFSPVVSG